MVRMRSLDYGLAYNTGPSNLSKLPRTLHLRYGCRALSTEQSTSVEPSSLGFLAAGGRHLSLDAVVGMKPTGQSLKPCLSRLMPET